MIKPKNLQLTRDQIRNINIDKIIYAELTEPGGMGNAGGIILYVIKQEMLICYELSIFNDEETYDQIGAMLQSNLHRNEFVADDSHQNIFHYFYGRMGNHVFININANLIIHENYFIHKKSNAEYQIIPSVQGVFNAVAEAMKNQSMS